MTGAEALLRISGPGGQLLTPASFITVAEETGPIVLIGERVLDDACRQLTAWRQHLWDLAPRNVSVNLAARQIMTRPLPSTVERTLERRRRSAQRPRRACASHPRAERGAR